jgi:ABC-type multidrug transport system fused ATPase/permease subunit
VAVRGTFLIGVLGMALFAATDGTLALFVKQFVDGTFYERERARVVAGADRRARVVPAARPRRLHVGVFPRRVGRRVIKAIRGDLFRHYLALPTRYYDREGTGHLLSRLTFNVEQVAEAVTKSITSLIRDTLTIIVLLSVVVYINWKLALFVLVLAPPLSWLIRNVSRSFRRYSGRIQSSMGDVTSAVKEALDGHRVIKVFNAQEAETADFEKVNEHNRKSNMKLIAARSISNPTVQFIASLGLGGILWVSLHQIQAGTMTPGDFMAFITATLMTTAPLKRLMDSFAPLQQGLAAGASIFELLDVPPEDLKSGPPAATRGGRARVPRRELRIHQREGRSAALGEPARAGGQDHRHCWTLRVGQVDAGGAGAALLRRHVRRGAHRRQRRARVQPARPAAERLAGQPGRAAVQRFDPQQHRLRRRRAGSGRGREGRAHRLRRRIRQQPAAGHGHAGGRARLVPVGRPEAAHRDRACPCSRTPPC